MPAQQNIPFASRTECETRRRQRIIDRSGPRRRLAAGRETGEVAR